MNPQFDPLLRAAARPFLKAGIYPWQFARWKLRLDPVFSTLLRRGCLPDSGRLFDVGCGQGVLLALLAAAREEHQAGRWPSDWPAPPLNLELQGVEQHRERAWVARRALRDRARVDRGDARELEFPRCSVVAVMDVLLYLGTADQERLLEKIAKALEPGGLLLMREADATGGTAYQLTRWSARLSGMGLGSLWPAIHCRSGEQWARDLEALGFSVSVEPMSEGVPFTNVLLTARKII